MGYQSHNTNTCGIHVHFNRDFYADNEELYLSRLLYLVTKFWEEIVIFSRRRRSRLNRYSKKPDDSIPNYLRSWNKTCDHEGHYYALNIINEETIEFRMFRGTLNILTFHCILDFVNAIVRAAKEKTAEDIQKMKFEELLSPMAMEYYKSRLEPPCPFSESVPD